MTSSPSISEAWALVLPSSFVETLFPLRLFEEIEIAVASDEIWVRGRNRNPSLIAMLASIPASQRFAWLAQDRLRPIHSRLATAQLPKAEWQPLIKWLQVALPTAGLPCFVATKLALQLVATTQTAEANALLTSAETWIEWLAQAPAVRLKSLKFAASSDGKVLVLGTPVPPLAGQRLVEIEGIIVPAGLTWSPAVSPTTLREISGVGPHTWVLWNETSVQTLSEESFVPATRSAAHAMRSPRNE